MPMFPIPSAATPPINGLPAVLASGPVGGRTSVTVTGTVLATPLVTDRGPGVVVLIPEGAQVTCDEPEGQPVTITGPARAVLTWEAPGAPAPV